MNHIVRTPPLSQAEAAAVPLEPARRPRRWMVLAALAVLAIGGIVLWQGRPARPGPAAPVRVATVPDVVGLGWLEPNGTVVRIGAPGNPDSSRVAWLAIEEGERVEAGQLLATLDAEPQRLTEVAQAEAQLRLRQVQLARQHIDHANLLAARRAALDRATAELRIAETEHERLRSLVASNATSRAAFERAARDLALAGASRREAEAALLRAEATIGAVAADIAVAMAELEATQADLATARARLELARIRAPFAGRVLSLKARGGERIGSDGLLELGATERMRAIVEVYQTDIARIRPGQSVTLRADALPTPLTGTVERLGHAVRRQTVINADPATATDARVIDVVVALPPDASARVAALSRLQVTAVFAP